MVRIGLVACLTAAAALVVALTGCPSPLLVTPQQSTVTLDVQARVVATPDATRIESLHFWPRGAGPEITFSEPDLSFVITNPDDSVSPPVAGRASLKGIEPVLPLDFHGTGRASLAVRGATGARAFVIHDGFGNALAVTAFTMVFEVFQLGQTNLSTRWELVLPMAGNNAKLAQATFFGVMPATTVTVGAGTDGGGTANLTDKTAAAAADIVLKGDPVAIVRPVSQATVTFTTAVP